MRLSLMPAWSRKTNILFAPDLPIIPHGVLRQSVRLLLSNGIDVYACSPSQVVLDCLGEVMLIAMSTVDIFMVADISH